MKFISISSAFIIIVILAIYTKPTTAYAYENRTKQIAEDIYSIANYGYAKPRNSGSKIFRTFSEMALFAAFIYALIFAWKNIEKLKEKFGKSITIILVGGFILILISIPIICSIEKDKEGVCRKKAFANSYDLGKDEKFDELFKICYKPSIFNPSGYYNIE